MSGARRYAGRLAGLALLAAAGCGPAQAANDPSAFNPRDDGAAAIGLQPLNSTRPAAALPARDVPAVANPLWGIPINSLTATRERPLFTPSRRPPAPPAVAAPIERPKPAAVAAEPEKPSLSLVGIVAGSTDGFAVFINNATRDIVRLKTGEGHEGWILRAVHGREVVLEKDRHTAVIALPPPAGDQK